MSNSSRGAESTCMRVSEPGRSGGAVLPVGFLEWQRESRIALFRTITSDGPGHVKTMPSHLPVLATRSEDGSINLATKGIGLVPKPDLLREFTSLFRDAEENSRRSAFDSTMGPRFGALLEFYGNPRNFDDSRLGGLEIFEGSTYTNLLRDRRASLLFSGEAPTFPSYQIDGLVEMVSIGDPHYEFLLAARELFASAQFHVVQRNYPHGYIFNVREVRDKSPFSRTV